MTNTHNVQQKGHVEFRADAVVHLNFILFGSYTVAHDCPWNTCSHCTAHGWDEREADSTLQSSNLELFQNRLEYFTTINCIGSLCY